MRGIPGSGKTTWIRDNLPGARVCSADHYFLDTDDVYQFDGALLPDAHGYCLRKYAKLLAEIESGTEEEPDFIAVDNTGIKAWEISPYYNLAGAYGHEVTIVNLECDPLLAHTRNIHGVSMERVEIMFQSMQGESLPAFWKLTVVRREADDTDGDLPV